MRELPFHGPFINRYVRSRRTVVRRESRSACMRSAQLQGTRPRAATRPRYRWILQVTTPSNISLSEPDDNSAAARRRRGRTRSAPLPISWWWRVMAVPRARRAPGRAVPGAAECLRLELVLRLRDFGQLREQLPLGLHLLLRRVRQQIVEPRRLGIARRGVAAPRV